MINEYVSIETPKQHNYINGLYFLIKRCLIKDIKLKHTHQSLTQAPLSLKIKNLALLMVFVLSIHYQELRTNCTKELRIN